MDTIVLPLRGRPRLLLGEFFAAMDEDTSKEGVWKVEAFRTWSDGPSWMVTGEVSEEDRHGLWVLASFCEERTSATFLGETAEDQDLRRRLDRCRFLVHCPFALPFTRAMPMCPISASGVLDCTLGPVLGGCGLLCRVSKRGP